MMQGRELGCKTLGCVAAVLIVMLCFYGMIATTQNLARKVKEKRTTKTTSSAAQNLQLVSIAVTSYEAATGHLPPTTSPKAFQNALAPRFLTDTSVLTDPGTGKLFSPNPVLSEKNRFRFRGKKVALLASEPNARGMRTVLLLSGEVVEMTTPTWTMLTAPQNSPPVPSEKSVPEASPVRSRR